MKHKISTRVNYLENRFRVNQPKFILRNIDSPEEADKVIAECELIGKPYYVVALTTDEMNL